MEKKADEENRKDHRRAAELKVDYRTDGSFVTDYSDNLSRRGLFIRTSHPLSVGERLRIRLQRPDGDGPFAFYGVVRWHRLAREAGERPAGMGVEFLDVSEEVRRYIEALLARLPTSGEE